MQDAKLHRQECDSSEPLQMERDDKRRVELGEGLKEEVSLFYVLATHTAYCDVSAEVKGQLVGAGSLLLPHGPRVELKLSGLIANAFIHWAILLALQTQV